MENITNVESRQIISSPRKISPVLEGVMMILGIVAIILLSVSAGYLGQDFINSFLTIFGANRKLSAGFTIPKGTQGQLPPVSFNKEIIKGEFVTYQLQGVLTNVDRSGSQTNISLADATGKPVALRLSLNSDTSIVKQSQDNFAQNEHTITPDDLATGQAFLIDFVYDMSSGVSEVKKVVVK